MKHSIREYMVSMHVAVYQPSACSPHHNICTASIKRREVQKDEKNSWRFLLEPPPLCNIFLVLSQFKLPFFVFIYTSVLDVRMQAFSLESSEARSNCTQRM